MPLEPGTRLGPYEILSPLGAGGMGEVYRARDGHLGLEVAIKVLPEAVAQDPDRLARFQREAQILAALNHPHIAAIYGLEKSGPVQALVLELVEGDTLADRIAVGPIPLDEALAMARQIADALEAAHERGIVHRDLKPANVKLTPGGKIKVLDFGLAKAVSGDRSSPDATSSPTLTGRDTEAGIILGSAAYMSPEQARGRPVDKRADIWAFGALLYEMLSGRRAFDGDTVSDTLAAVLMKDPDWNALPARTPKNVRKVLRRCLERDRDKRLHDIADAKLELDEAPEPDQILHDATSEIATPRRRLSAGLPAALAVLFALLAAAGWWSALRKDAKPAEARATALTVALPESDQIPFDDSPVLDISRDGRQLVFVSDRDGTRRLMVRSLDRVGARPVAGTERAYSPFFSPDGQWIGFFADGKLKKIPSAGGVPIVLAEALNNRGGVWLSDDRIVYAPEFSTGLMRVPAGGGKAEVLTTPDTAGGERTHRWPSWLPGDDSVLFTIGTLKNPGSYNDARIAVFDAKTNKIRVVLTGGSMARYAPSGHLVYVRSETLMAAPFDARRREVAGDPVALSDRAAGDPSSGIIYAAVGGDGTLAYAPIAETSNGSSLVLVDRAGKSRPLPAPPRPYHYPRFSPDGKRLAVTIGLGHGNRDEVWICDVATGGLQRLTFGDENGNYYPVWSGDGTRVAYSSDRGHQGIFWKGADGTGAEEALYPDARPDLPSDWSRDGKTLAFMRNYPTTEAWTISLADRKESPVEINSATPVFSPDGRWLAYTVLPGVDSPAQVLVKPVEGAGKGGKIQITSDLGAFPVWTDKEIVFLSEKTLVAIEVQTQPTFQAGTRRELFETPYERSEMPLRNYDVTRDGQTFVFVRGASDRTRNIVHVVLNWSSGLAREAPAKR
ncbi:MAG: protein kinase [Acidobacteriota bacterium]